MNRRRLIITGTVFILLLISLVSLGRSTHKAKPVPTKQNISQFVSINNIGQYSSQLGSSVSELESTLYQKIASTKDVTTNLSGTIRLESFTTQYNVYNGSVTPVQVPQYAFLVDIPSIKQTYQVTLNGGDDYPFKILYVLCPQPNQLIYSAFECKDEE